MRVKRKLNTDIAEKIRGHSSVELTDKCPDQRQVFPATSCTNSSCEYSIKESGYMNCAFVAAEAGAHTLEAIGEMMQMTREGVRLIERRALIRFRAGWEKLTNADGRTALPERCPPAGTDRIHPDEGCAELENGGDVVPALHGRELVQRTG